MSEQPQEPASTQDVQDTPTTEATPETAAGTDPGAETGTDAGTDAGPGEESAPESVDGASADAERPAPVPQPGPRPGPAPRRRPAPPASGPTPAEAGAPSAPAATEVAHLTSVDREAAAAFGRVDENGQVWVRRGDGEHEVGQYPDAGPAEALDYFVDKYESLVAQVDLFEQRLRSTELSGKDIDAGVKQLRTAMAETRAVGDLDALAHRVEALATIAEDARAAADRARAESRERQRAARTAIVEEAETIAGQDPEKVQWKQSGERLRDLFEEWKTAQRDGRLDKRSEDELWKRFSHARSGFDRMRRHHFAALGEQRSSVRQVKEKLIARAEALATSTDWRGTSTAYRQLMDEWKDAGRLGRKDDDALWNRFRAAQDVFFAARAAANDEVDAEFRENLAVKEKLADEAETLLPIKDLNQTKARLRDLQERWEAAGRVPRGDMQRIEGRLRAVENAVRDAEQHKWTASNPEAKARAEGVVGQLESAIRDLQADVDKARATGDARRLAKAEEALAARQAWLESAQRTLRDVGR
ncbi:DUF349 domain-containing protein [Kineococcus gynurae]|uniref:DUF349 domain-containing protein n=1 Tax=Kineococcus gynurae TaxID=452979 RepID=A0ABV5LUU9_9ACTN